MKTNKINVQSIEMLAELGSHLISVMPCHIYWKDTDGKYLGCNQLHAENLGFSTPDEIVGKTDFELPWASQAETLQATDQQVMHTKKLFI